MEDFARYIKQIVEPTVRDLENNPTSVRHAFLACVAIFHAVDYLAYPRKSRSLRLQFRSQSDAFKTVDEVAHAFKHVVTGKYGAPDILAASAVISRPIVLLGPRDITVEPLTESDYFLTIRNRGRINLLGTIKSAVKFLKLQIPGADKTLHG
jgi:hypothetical protein